MSTVVKLDNYSTKTLAHPSVPGSVAALAAGTVGTDTRTHKQVNADDFSGKYAVLAKAGIVVTVDGTAEAGSEVVTAVATAALTSHVVIVDTDAPGFTLTLQPAATVGKGFRMYIYIRTAGGGNLTVDGDAAELVLGSATQVISAAGDVLYLESDGVSAWTAQT